MNMMQVIRSSKRINVIYFTPKDHKGNVFIIDPETSKVTSSTHSTVVTTDFTVVSSFNCQVKPPTDKINTEYIDCIFTTHGPYIFRVQLNEDPGTGLVEVTSSPLKGRFEMFYDNVARKVTFNENYFAVLSTSVKSGDIRILVYRFLDKQGTSYLWSGLKLEDYSKRRIEDVDLVMHPSDKLIFLTNTFEDSSTTTFVKSVQLKEAEITVLDPIMDKLGGERIKFNDRQTDIEQSYVPISNFFLHLDEQNSTRLFNSNKWYHWIILIIACVATYGYLFFRWKKEGLRRQKLREEVLCNNLDDVIKL